MFWVRPTRATMGAAGANSCKAAVAKGASVCPPEGLPEMHAFVDALAKLDKDIYCICEQDCYPCEPTFPKQNAINMRNYLADCGLGLK